MGTFLSISQIWKTNQQSSTQNIQSSEKNNNRAIVNEGDGPASHQSQNSHSIRVDLYQFLQKLNQPKPSLTFLIGTFSVLLYTIARLEGKLNNQSDQIIELKMQIAALNKQLYLKDTEQFPTHAQDKVIPNLQSIYPQFTPGVIKVTSNTTLNNDALGKLIVLEKPNLHLTLPPILFTGFTFKFFGTFARTINGKLPCFIKMGNDNSIIQFGNNHDNEKLISVNSGEYLELVANKEDNCWYAANRNAGLGLTPGFEWEIAGNRGWQRLPSGMLVQWGGGSSTNGGMLDVRFPQPFTSRESISIHGTHYGSGPSFVIEFANTLTETGGRLRLLDYEGKGYPDRYMKWMAIGY